MQRVGHHLFARLEGAHILLELAKDEEAAEGGLTRKGRVFDQRQLERKCRVPLRRAGCLDLVVDVFLQHQRLAAAVDVAEVLDAIAARVLQCRAVLHVDDLAARVADQFFDACRERRGLADGFVRGEHHAVHGFAKVHIPVVQRTVGERIAAGLRGHAVAEVVARGTGRDPFEAQRLVARERKRHMHERAAAVAVAAGLEGFGVEQLAPGAGHVEVAQLAQQAFGSGDVDAEREEDVGRALTAVAFEDIALQALQQLAFVDIGGFPGERLFKIDGHDGVLCVG